MVLIARLRQPDFACTPTPKFRPPPTKFRNLLWFVRYLTCYFRNFRVSTECFSKNAVVLYPGTYRLAVYPPIIPASVVRIAFQPSWEFRH